LLWRSGKLIALVSGAASLALFLLAEPVVLLAGGRSFLGAAPLLRWLAPLPLVVALSGIFGVQIMLPNNMTSAFNRILAAAGGVSLGLIALWVAWRGAEGAAINTLLVECIVTGLMAAYLYCQRNSVRAG